MIRCATHRPLDTRMPPNFPVAFLLHFWASLYNYRGHKLAALRCLYTALPPCHPVWPHRGEEGVSGLSTYVCSLTAISMIHPPLCCLCWLRRPEGRPWVNCKHRHMDERLRTARRTVLFSEPQVGGEPLKFVSECNFQANKMKRRQKRANSCQDQPRLSAEGSSLRRRSIGVQRPTVCSPCPTSTSFAAPSISLRPKSFLLIRQHPCLPSRLLIGDRRNFHGTGHNGLSGRLHPQRAVATLQQPPALQHPRRPFSRLFCC